ncbi:MAG: CdaR family protein [Thermodesulfovibrionia bacterium]|nr:CdaR family protein [Thermodesulfovibrionia bacterium]
MIKEFFLTNIWLKLISLVFAVSLWFFVITGSQIETVVQVPIKFVNMPKGLELAVAPDKVSVGIEGYERVIDGLGKHDITFELNMSKVKNGMNVFTLSEENVKLPGHLEVNSISPQTVSLMLQERN